ncbi:MAG: PorT family protein [Firmicutes bacterium]|nr:PorT family protein [Bacillota bacterium]
MKKIALITILYLFVFNIALGQDKENIPKLNKTQRFDTYDMQRFHFGFSVGIDIVGASLKTKINEVSIVNNKLIAIESEFTPAFNVALVANMRMGKYLDLQFAPGFSIAHDINLYYKFANPVPNPNQWYVSMTDLVLRKIECQYFNFPLLVKAKSPRINDICRIYVIAGGQVCLNMMSTKNNKINTMDPSGKDIIPIIKPYDMQVKGGFGFDFYTKYLKFSPEFKFSCGVINLLENLNNVKDQSSIANYTDSPIYKGIKSLKSRTFTVSFIFGGIREYKKKLSKYESKE